ncbi:hypothetical protein KEM48_002895 [Puccinia striiformis f. sp. tritici PST-130]|nr:hypothetical protein KEM48_002895 [Puccinia striiformis f. sp. tritici PST-130]
MRTSCTRYATSPIETLEDLMIHALGSGLDSDPLPTSPRGSANEKDLDPDLGIAPSTDFLKNPLPFDHPKAKDFRENHSICQRGRQAQVKRRYRYATYGGTPGRLREEVGAKMPEGYNEYLSDRTIMLFKDPVRVTLRPLTLSYGLAWTSNEIIRHVLKYKGFKLKSSSNRKNGLKYFVRIPDSWKKLPPDQRPPPLYCSRNRNRISSIQCLIKYLNLFKWGNERPVMIFVQPHISMEIFSPAFFLPPNESQLTGDVKEAFENLGFYETGVELLAHSNGTVVAGWIIKAFPKLVKRSCLLDPIVLLYDAVLWPHQVPGFRDPKRFIVILSGKDAILNAGRIRRYLLDGGMTDAFPRPKKTPTHLKNTTNLSFEWRLTDKILDQRMAMRAQASESVLAGFS